MPEALIIESEAVHSLLFAGGPPPQWSDTFDFHDPSAGVTSITGEGFIYVCGATANRGGLTLVLRLTPDGLFDGFPERRRTEVLLRVCTALELLAAEGGRLPTSWRPWSGGNFLCFQATSIGSKDSRRVAIWRDLIDRRCVYVFDVTSRQADYNRLDPDLELLDRALRWVKLVEGTASDRLEEAMPAVAVVELERRELRAFTQAESLDHLQRNYLTAEQRRFVDARVDQPIRLHGAAGTGKTLAMVAKTLRELYACTDNNNPCRILFLTHNDSAADLVRQYLSLLDDRHLAAAPPGGATGIEVSTLLALAAREVLPPERDVSLISTDAQDGKRLQLVVLSDVVQSYRRGPWVTRRGKATECVRRGVEAAVDSPDSLLFCWDLMTEIAVGLDGDRVRDNPARRDAYRRGNRPAYRMHLPAPGDRDVVLDLYDAYRMSLRQSGYMSTDQVIADFIGYLESFNWDFRRDRSGYDAVFVDEFHLFNQLERLAFQPLLRRVDGPPAIVMALDPRQSPRETFLDLSLPGEDTMARAPIVPGFPRAEKFQLDEVFRFTPEILELLKFVNRSFPVEDFRADWEMAPPTSRRAAGSTPVAEEAPDRVAQYRRAFEIAAGLQRADRKTKVAILSLSFVGFTDVAGAAQFNEQAVLIESREERLPKQTYSRRRPVLSLAEYVAGYQFDHVILTDVNERSETEDRQSSAGLRRFLSTLYLGVSRAQETVSILGIRTHGGLAGVIIQAANQGLVHISR